MSGSMEVKTIVELQLVLPDDFKKEWEYKLGTFIEIHQAHETTYNQQKYEQRMDELKTALIGEMIKNIEEAFELGLNSTSGESSDES